ncbi:glycoside hydrolase [Tothia fuscella]|uniref:chitinase n=1 Tax=Tothia fuscella TaxID=1048955 RepID=A0A9P4NQ83_9PEZI|nr:glycoside hydrolase [Tothia fuscella]
MAHFNVTETHHVKTIAVATPTGNADTLRITVRQHPRENAGNCAAKALCGKDSLGGLMRCGLNLCCSHYGWCGTEEVHYGNADPKGRTASCQEGYGGCQQHQAPVCAEDSGTTNGRAVAYYQSWNVRKRTCQKVYPSQINTNGLTHLYYAFASIDPATWQIVTADPADDELIREFTKLKSSTLSTWIAVGGFEFSDPGLTRTTWSEMVANPGHRAAFIWSCIAFMEKYGFQGIDLDWEYPAADQRGGNLDDTSNLVTLIKEMRGAFGSKYGMSSVLAPDYWYLRGTDVKAMEPYMDFFGFMGYDLHGSWDTDVHTLGAIVRPQSDIREIEKILMPLWYAGIDPAKINFGLPYYGRGEIRQLIKTKNLHPTLNREAMVKQISWDDQWIGYDDDETILMKKRFANSKCLVGTMIWAIDYDSESDLGGPNFGVTPQKGSGVAVEIISNKCDIQHKWNCHHCADGELDDGTVYDMEKWELADGEALWNHTKSWYTDYAATMDFRNLDSFTRKVGYYVAKKQGMNCGLANGADRCSWGACESIVGSPAARYLLNQFANMRSFYSNWAQALGDVKGDLALKITSLQADFAPPEKKDVSLKIILDILNVGVAFSSAFAWNRVLRDIPYYQKTKDNPNKANDQGWHKDTANAAVTGGIAIAKDMIMEESMMKTRAKLESLADTMTDKLKENVEKQYELLISGRSEGIEALDKQFRHGFWTDNHLKNVTLHETQQMFSKILVGQLLVPTWGLSSKVWPVIIMEDKENSLENPMASDSQPKKRGLEQYGNVTVSNTGTITAGDAAVLIVSSVIKDGDAAAIRVHHDRKTLWLLDGHVCPDTNVLSGSRTPQQFCGNSPLWKLPGADKLDGNEYHGITIEDIIISSYEGFKANGNKNGYGPELQSLVETYQDNLLRAPGFFHGIPICDYKTFKTNWWRADGAMTGKTNKVCPEYPCCPGPKTKPI